MKRTLWILATATALMAGGCAPVAPTQNAPAVGPLPTATAPPSTEPPEAPATPAPTTIPPTPSIPIDVEIPTADGLTLRGTFHPAAGGDGGAVLLLHMYRADRTTWDPLVEGLAASGIASLAIDLRGHGQTGGAEDWAAARQDVAAAIGFLGDLSGVDPAKVGIAGASIGANLSLVQAAQYPGSVAAVALLSPGLDYFRVQIDSLIGQIRGVPVFLAASENDGYSADTVRTLAAQSTDPVVMVLGGAAHGTDMFAANPELIEGLVGFFRDALGTRDG